MEVVLVLRELSATDREEISKLKSGGAVVYVLPGIKFELSDNVYLIPDFVIRKAITDLIQSVKGFGDKVINGEHLSDILSIDRIPLWHYQRFRIFFKLRTEWIINECISHFSDQNNVTAFIPDGVIVPVKTTNIIYSKPVPAKSSKTRLNYLSLFNYVVFFTIRILISLLRKVKIKDKEDVIIDRSIRQVCRNIKTLEKKTDNFILYPLFDSNPGGQLIISEVETPKLNSANPFQLHKYYFNGEGRKRKTVYGEWILFRGLLSLAVIKEYKSLKSELVSRCNFLIENKASSTVYSDHERRMLECFIALHKSSTFYIFKHLCYYRFFEKYHFRTITAIDENSPATKCILDAAKKCSIRTIGIQHGNIGDTQPAYLYSQRDGEKKIMSDITITWGEYFTEFLIKKGNYPKDSVKTAGQMRSDIIPLMLNKANDFKRELTKESSVVLFASQPIQDPNYRYMAAYDIFSCFSEIEDTRLIVKLHPGERFDTGYYEKIALQAGYKSPDIRYEVDLYDVIAASDIVITCFSTVGSEAIFFGKPLIIYDPLKEDLLKYVHEGVAYQATNLESLKTVVQNLKGGKLGIDGERYSEFIRKYAYAIDGNATDRTLKIIRGDS